MKIKLEDLISHLENVYYINAAFFDKTSGEIKFIPEDVTSFIEDKDSDEEELPDWEKEFVPVYRDIMANPEIYIELPDRYYFNTYEIMEQFIFSLSEGKIRNDLYSAIQGSGAFERFRDAVERHTIVKEWVGYKEEALKEIAIQWCRENDLEYY